MPVLRRLPWPPPIDARGWSARRWAVAVAVAAGVAAGAAPAAHADAVPDLGAVRAVGPFHQTNLIADQPGQAKITDPNLVNPWGLSSGPFTALWVADNGTGVSTLDVGDVFGLPPITVPLVVSIPGGAPTGTVYNPTGAFAVRNAGGNRDRAWFLFDSEAGQITGWSPFVPPLNGAQTAVNRPTAIYKGLALAQTGQGPLLYAADFHNDRVDVFDGNFNAVQPSGTPFMDSHIPSGFAPFNVQNVDGRIVVTYAKQDAAGEDDVPGVGNGYVDVYDTSGRLLQRLASGGPLNSPWGVVQAPDGFGSVGGDLLVGNFGDGLIHVYDPHDGRLLGRLTGDDGRPIQIDGLWALQFGNGLFGSDHTLVFSSGPDDEAHGLLGDLTPAAGRG